MSENDRLCVNCKWYDEGFCIHPRIIKIQGKTRAAKQRYELCQDGLFYQYRSFTMLEVLGVASVVLSLFSIFVMFAR